MCSGGGGGGAKSLGPTTSPLCIPAPHNHWPVPRYDVQGVYVAQTCRDSVRHVSSIRKVVFAYGKCTQSGTCTLYLVSKLGICFHSYYLNVLIHTLVFERQFQAIFSVRKHLDIKATLVTYVKESLDLWKGLGSQD